MATELTERKVENSDNTTVSTSTTENKTGTGSSSRTGQSVSTVSPATMESTQVQAAITATDTTTEDLGVTISFSIPIMSRRAVLPPGETAPAAC